MSTVVADADARILNALHTWHRGRGAQADRLLRAADATVTDLLGLAGADLIATPTADHRSVQVRIRLDDHRHLHPSRYRVRLTEAGTSWVNQPSNMLLRAIDLSGRIGLSVGKAMEICYDSRIVRRVIDDGYATLHNGSDMEVRQPHRWNLATTADLYLRPTKKILRRVGS